jgi:hypothetical protein
MWGLMRRGQDVRPLFGVGSLSNYHNRSSSGGPDALILLLLGYSPLRSFQSGTMRLASRLASAQNLSPRHLLLSMNDF